MKIIKYTAIICWRIWFYFIMILTILPLFPVLVVITAKEEYYTVFYKLAHYWGKTILFLMGFRPEITREAPLIPGKNYIFVANHTSMMDIMLMLALIPDNPFVFVGKKELQKIPVLGYAYRRTMILVDRSSVESRKKVFYQTEKKLEKGFSICIFPEGMVPEDRNTVLAPFKKGAFVLGIEHGIPLVPISFLDNKKRFSYDFFSGSPGKLRVIIHKAIDTKGMDIKNMRELMQKTYDILYRDLSEG